MTKLAHVLPLPGPVWGAYPIRPAEDVAPPQRYWHWRSGLAVCRSIAQAAVIHAEAWARLDVGLREKALSNLRSDLRRHGLRPAEMARALGVASACATETLGLTPRPTQCLAAAALLDNRMAEMATGEGKTLAIALAAAVAALAGMPVHVVTANEYLAGRDAARMMPLFAGLGLRVAALSGAEPDECKQVIYGHDVVYTTAKALAFDFLRDRQAMQGGSELERAAGNLVATANAPLLMRGLCMALLDEADSILLDEAEVPLILSRSAPHAARRAFLWQALALARQLKPGQDFVVHATDQVVALTALGEDCLARLASGLGGPWQRPRYRREALTIALAGLYAFHRNEHYVVRDGAIELLDEVTGRVAPGRVWSRGLHTVVALKEGLSPPPETETVAQITFQRFFQRYWRLCGISGTLHEARGELRAVYGAPLVRVPLHRPSQRRALTPRRFETHEAMFEAVVQRARELAESGRPILIGTDNVADSHRLSQYLLDHRMAHQLLNALNDAEEAAIVAQAGVGGCITVATRMAGRGTDIELDERARLAGGLHVLSCQNNSSRRLDRQLAGRAGRHGDPGSVEAWSFEGFSSFSPYRFSLTSTPEAPAALPRLVPPVWMWRVLSLLGQWREERRRTLLRQSLLEQDLHWEQRLAFAGAPHGVK